MLPLAPDAEAVAHAASRTARAAGHYAVTPVHIVAAAAEAGHVDVLDRAGVDTDWYERELARLSQPNLIDRRTFVLATASTIEAAGDLAAAEGRSVVDLETLVVAAHSHATSR